MRLLTSTFLFLALAGGAIAEVVSTTDGRTIQLNADGTFKLIEDKAASSIMLSEQKPFFEHYAGEYNQNSMRFMPIFLNETGKTIVGFKFTTSFKSAFGDDVFSFPGESSEKVPAGKLSTAEAFYFFEDNQFMADQPYDKLKIFDAAGTGTITTKVTAVVFEDGTVIKAEP